MKTKHFLLIFSLISLLILSACKNPFRYTDAREIPVDANERVKKILKREEVLLFFQTNKKVGFSILHHPTNYGEHLLKYWIL